MRHYEVTFIVDPVLSGDEIKRTAKTYEDMLVTEGSGITHIDEMGLKQLAYPINKRSSGIYYCIEFSNKTGTLIPKLELALRRDERIMRFLTVGLDKYGVNYNEDKRQGRIGVAKKAEKEESGKDEKKERGKETARAGRKPRAERPAQKAAEAVPVAQENSSNKSEEE